MSLIPDTHQIPPTIVRIIHRTCRTNDTIHANRLQMYSITERPSAHSLTNVVIYYPQDRTAAIYSFTICRKSSPTPTWPPRSCPSETCYPPKCLSISRRTCRSALDSCRMTTHIQRKRPSKRCTASRLEQKDLRCNWNDPKKPPSHIDRERVRNEVVELIAKNIIVRRIHINCAASAMSFL